MLEACLNIPTILLFGGEQCRHYLQKADIVNVASTLFIHVLLCRTYLRHAASSTAANLHPSVVVYVLVRTILVACSAMMTAGSSL